MSSPLKVEEVLGLDRMEELPQVLDGGPLPVEVEA